MLSDLPCGRLEIAASLPGFLPIGAHQIATLVSGKPARDQNVLLVPQSVVTGKITDQQGDAMMNAQVTALASRVAKGIRTFQMLSTVRTNDLGEFRIAGLPAGKFIFCALAPPFIFITDQGGYTDDSTASVETCYPGPVDAVNAAPVSLAAGQKRQLDLVVRRVPGVHVRGRATGLPKLQNPSPAITLLPAGAERWQAFPSPIDAAGLFDIPMVAPGAYKLVVNFTEPGFLKPRLAASIPVNVGASDVAGIVVPVRSGLTLTGSIRVESALGMVFPDPRWLPGLLAADPEFPDAWIRPENDTSTFMVVDVFPGEYHLEAKPPPPFYLKRALLDGHDVTSGPIVITQSSAKLEIILGDNGGTIEGTIEDIAGQPAQGSVLLLQDGWLQANIASDSQGRFRIAGVPPGDYDAFAWDDLTDVEYANAGWMKRHGERGQSLTIQPGLNQALILVRESVGLP